MKIGVLTTSYPDSDDDPAGHFVRGHAEWLASHAGDVEVLVCGGDFESGGLPLELRRRPWLAATIAARLFGAAITRGFDVVVSHWLVPCAAVGMMLRRPHVAIAHGSDIALLRRLPGGESFVRFLSARAHLVYVAESLRIEGAPGLVQPMPPMEGTPMDRVEARRALGLGDEPVALFLGRLVHDKGCDLLLDALPAAMMLLIAGDGPERARLSRHPAVIPGRARLLGACYGADKARLLAAADLLVVPSRIDGAPTVVGEAHRARLPVLATNVGGVPSVVAQGGWLVPPTIEALRDILTRFARHPLERPTLPSPPTWPEIAPHLWPFSHKVTPDGDTLPPIKVTRLLAT